MLQQYTLSELQTFNRTQLWEIARKRGLKCYPKTVDCVEAILMKQQSVEKMADAEVEVDEQAVVQSEFEAQTKTCATCPLFKPFNDGTSRGLCCGVPDTSLVVREHHPLTGDCLHLIEEANVADIQSVSAQNPIPGYDFCLSQDIEFKQRTGSETGIIYWYAVTPHYYGQTNRQYKTGGFEKLENCVKAAVDYLGKCGVDTVEVKQQLINYLRYGAQTEPKPAQSQPLVEQKPSFQSGELFFTPVTNSCTTYTVKRWDIVIGEISMNVDVMWEAVGIDILFTTPYEAAAALLEQRIKKADPGAVVRSVKSDEVVSKPIAELDHNQCEVLCQESEIPEIEIDSESDPDFGDLYRVWNGMTLLGTFFQGVADNKWIAQMVDDEGRHYCDTEFEAQLLIIAKSGLLVADAVDVDIDNIDDLLDKPFDELTDVEWQRLKQYKFDSENLAAA